MVWKKSLPAGTKDKLFREAEGTYDMEKQICQVFADRGFHRIETPVMEFEDVFNQQAKQTLSLYRLFDAKGRLIVLRPDMTSPVARVISSANISLPLQLYYSGKIFRANEDLSGSRNEWTQIGVEVVGYASHKAEINCLLCAEEVLRKLQIKDFHIELSHAAIYHTLMKISGFEHTQQQYLTNLLIQKNLTELRRFVAAHPSDLDAFILMLPRLIGDPVDTIRRAKQVTSHPVIHEAFDEVLQIYQTLMATQPELSVSVDLCTVPTLSYYSGVMFAGYADSAPDAVFNGGRYDSLLNYFGFPETPAVGLAFNLDALIALQYKLDLFPKLQAPAILIHFDTAQTGKARQLQTTEKNARLSLFDELPDSIAFAQQWHYDKVIVLTESGRQDICLKEDGE